MGLEDIEWPDDAHIEVVVYQRQESQGIRASLAPVKDEHGCKLKAYKGWKNVLWWMALMLSIVWCIVVGTIGLLLFFIPVFCFPLLGLAGAPAGSLIARRIDKRNEVIDSANKRR